MPSEPRLVSQTASDAFLRRKDELPYRHRRQALLPEFGTAALQTRDFRQILPDPGQFDDADADFLAGFAGLLGIAIERQHAESFRKPSNMRTCSRVR